MSDTFIRDSVNDLSKYIPGRQEEDVKKEFGLKEVIKLASNENPFGPSPKAVDAIQRSLKEVSVYPDQHHIMLREALSKKLNVGKDNIIIGNGSDEIMLLIAQTFLSAGEESVISNNTFSVYEFVTKLMNGTPVYVDLNNYTYDLEAFIKNMTTKTKLAFICNPNNPTGTFAAFKKIEEFMSKVPKSVIVVVDEAYGDYSDHKDFKSAVGLTAKYENLIVLKTFSKIYGLAGLRVGYGAAAEKLIKYINLVKLPFNVNRTGQTAALAALSDERFVEKSLANNKEGKAFLYSELAKLGLKYLETQANFIFIETGKKCDQVFLSLMREGVIIRPLTSFGMENAIRVTIGQPEQNSKFITALKKVL